MGVLKPGGDFHLFVIWLWRRGIGMRKCSSLSEGCVYGDIYEIEIVCVNQCHNDFERCVLYGRYCWSYMLTVGRVATMVKIMTSEFYNLWRRGEVNVMWVRWALVMVNYVRSILCWGTSGISRRLVFGVWWREFWRRLTRISRRIQYILR